MKDKIIVDGVDVGGCENYRPNTDLTCGLGYGGVCDSKFKSNANCYYKQLIRLQNQYNAVVEQNRQLQHELKAEKQKVEYLELRCQELSSHGDYLNNLALSKTLDMLSIEVNKYKQALEEIKTLIQKIEDEGCIYGDFNCDNCSSLEERNVCTHKIIKLILQKCEALKDE